MVDVWVSSFAVDCLGLAVDFVATGSLCGILVVCFVNVLSLVDVNVLRLCVDQTLFLSWLFSSIASDSPTLLLAVV